MRERVALLRVFRVTIYCYRLRCKPLRCKPQGAGATTGLSHDERVLEERPDTQRGIIVKVFNSLPEGWIRGITIRGRKVCRTPVN